MNKTVQWINEVGNICWFPEGDNPNNQERNNKQWWQLLTADQSTEAVKRDPLLASRQSTHGNFDDNARISQDLKDVLDSNADMRKLDPVYREALDMIFLKISRIVSGKAHVKDHWDDIAGYAKLGAELCERDMQISERGGSLAARDMGMACDPREEASHRRKLHGALHQHEYDGTTGTPNPHEYKDD